MHLQQKLPVESSRTGFLDLPPELRIQIYRQVLPSNFIIFFNRPLGPFQRSISVIPQNAEIKIVTQLPTYNFQFHVCLVSRVIAREAYGIIYGENIFIFEAQGRRDRNRCSDPPPVWDPFGFPKRQRVFGHLQKIILTIDFDQTREYSKEGSRMRASLDRFVRIMEKSEPDLDKCQLKKLSIQYLGNTPRDSPGFEEWASKLMFVAEPLAALKGLDHVYCAGFDPWFGACLEMCIKGEGGDIKQIDWPVKEIRRRNPTGGKKHPAQISERQWWQPKLDWREFALRNGASYDAAACDHFFEVVEE